LVQGHAVYGNLESDTLLQSVKGYKNENVQLYSEGVGGHAVGHAKDPHADAVDTTSANVVCHGCVQGGHCLTGFNQSECDEAGHMWRPETHSEELCDAEVFEYKASNSLDVDGDGFVSVEDLTTVMMEMGDPKPTEVQMELLKWQLQFIQDRPVEETPEGQQLLQVADKHGANLSSSVRLWGTIVNVVSHGVAFTAHTMEGGSPEEYVVNQLKDPWFWAGLAGVPGGKSTSKIVRALSTSVGVAGDVNTFFGTVKNAQTIANELGGPRRRRDSAEVRGYISSLRRRRSGTVNTKQANTFQLKNPTKKTCLYIAGGGVGYNSQPIKTWDCTGHYNAVWAWDGQRLKNPATGKCLAINGASGTQGAEIVLWDCVNAWNLNWEVSGNTIRNPGTNLCLTILEHQKAKDAKMVTWRCGSNWNIQFKVEPAAVIRCPPLATADGRCGPLFDHSRCDNQRHSWALYCNEQNGWCGNTDAHRNAQASGKYDWNGCSCPPLSTQVGRCGPLAGYSRCNKQYGSDQLYCNEQNGWCGNTHAHRTAQASSKYDWNGC